MREDTIFDIYCGICGLLLPTKREIADRTGYSVSTVGAATLTLNNAGLIREHLVGNEVRFSGTGVLFAVFDATGDEYFCFLFDEALKCREKIGYIPESDFMLHDNICGFVRGIVDSPKMKKAVSVCLLPPSNFDAFCAEALPDYIAVVKKSKARAVELMREKYFSVKLKRVSKNEIV